MIKDKKCKGLAKYYNHRKMPLPNYVILYCISVKTTSLKSLSEFLYLLQKPDNITCVFSLYLETSVIITLQLS